MRTFFLFLTAILLAGCSQYKIKDLPNEVPFAEDSVLVEKQDGRCPRIIEAAKQVHDAFTIPGPDATYHKKQKDHLRSYWSTLFKALEKNSEALQ